MNVLTAESSNTCEGKATTKPLEESEAHRPASWDFGLVTLCLCSSFGASSWLRRDTLRNTRRWHLVQKKPQMEPMQPGDSGGRKRLWLSPRCTQLLKPLGVECKASDFHDYESGESGVESGARPAKGANGESSAFHVSRLVIPILLPDDSLQMRRGYYLILGNYSDTRKGVNDLATFCLGGSFLGQR